MRSYLIKIWENEDLREQGISDIIRTDIKDIRTAVQIAQEIQNNNRYACIEVQDNQQKTSYYMQDMIEEKIFEKVESYIHRLARVEKIKYVDESHKTIKQSASAVVSNSKIIVPLSGLIDLNEEIKRQNKKLEKLLSEKNSLLARTNNEKFMANAKPELIEQTKNRIDEITVQEKAINDLISSLKY